MTGTRIAVAGAGWWSSAIHLPALSADPAVEVVAVIDPSPDRRDAAMRSFGIPHAFAELIDALDAISVDGVIVATPHHTHARLAELCLLHGVSVLVEKPMATTAEDAWHIVETERASTGQVVAGLTYQFSACAEAVRAAVHGEIGDVVSVNAEFSSTTGNLFATLDEADAHLDRPDVAHGTTYSDPDTGGGQGYTQLSHLLGALLWATGEQATDVFAFMDCRDVRVDVVDALAFRLTGGALCVASSTGTTPPGVMGRHRIRFHGTAGMVEWDMLEAEAWIHSEGGHITHLANPVDRAAYAAAQVAVEFARVIAGEAPNPAPSAPAAASIALIEAAYRSAETGERVAVLQGELDV
jgi:predicted dehydrogenase